MTDYQGLYEESKHHIKQLQKRVASLQDEIRERCQSYLLQNSGIKKKTQNKSTIRNMKFKHLFSIHIQPQIKPQSNKKQILKTNQKLSNSKTQLPNSPPPGTVLQTPKKQYMSEIKKPITQSHPQIDDSIIMALKQRLSDTQAAKNQIFKDMIKLQEKHKLQEKELAKVKPIFQQNEKLKKKIDTLTNKNKQLMEAMSLIDEQFQRIPIQNNLQSYKSFSPIAKAQQCLNYLKNSNYSNQNLEKSEAKNLNIHPNIVESIFKYQPQDNNKEEKEVLLKEIDKLKKDLEIKDELQRQYLRVAEELTYLKTKKVSDETSSELSKPTRQIVMQKNASIEAITNKVQVLQKQNLKNKADLIQAHQKETKNLQKIIMLEKQNASLREEIQSYCKKLQQLPTRRRSSTDNSQEIARLKAANKDLKEQIQLLKIQKRNLAALQPPKNQDLLPIYVEQDMDIDTDQYVQRKFVRKKIIRRNLSAMTFKSVSKSKRDVIESLQSKLKNLKQSAKNDPEQESKMKKYVQRIDKLKKDMERNSNRISEASKQDSQNPSSNMSESSDGRIYFFQMETETPNKSTYAGKIVDTRKINDEERKNRFDFAKKGKTQSSGVL